MGRRIVYGRNQCSDCAGKGVFKDADSDVLFQSEENALTMEEYTRLKTLALKSAIDFQKLYDSVPDKQKSNLANRKTFYGQVPRTAEEMYLHTKNVNSYYFNEIENVFLFDEV